MKIEVAYARPDKQAIITLELREGSTAELAIRESGVLTRFPEIDLEINRIGVFAKPCKLDHTLREGDRVEIYRPLLADPKQTRRNRAAGKS